MLSKKYDMQNFNVLLVVFAIIAAIYLGEKYNTNTGYFALGFAYLIGTFALNLSVNDIIGMWPTNLFLVIFCISLFFNFANANGAMQKMAMMLLYSSRKFVQFLPLILYFITALVSAMGAGFFTSVALMGGIAMILCKNAKIEKITPSIAVALGALSGGNFMSSQHGNIFRGIIQKTDLALNVETYVQNIFLVSFIYPIILISILIFINSRKNKSDVQSLNIEKPSSFDSKQKTSLLLVLIMVLIVLGFPFLTKLLPGVEWVKFVNSKINISFIALLLALVSYILKLADPKEVISNIPWNTIWLVCGVGVLVDVAVSAGAIEVLSSLVNSFPAMLIPVALCFIGGIMSFFSSTLGVVAPLMFPMVVVISAATGIDPSLLFIATIIGAQSTTLAPFSTGGTLIMSSSALDDAEREFLYHNFLYKATPQCLLYACIATIIIQIVFFR